MVHLSYVALNFVDTTLISQCWKHLLISVTLLEWSSFKHSGLHSLLTYKASFSVTYCHTLHVDGCRFK